MKKELILPVGLLCFILATNLSAGSPEIWRDQMIDNVITHFGNGNPESALEVAEELSCMFPRDSYFNFLTARAIGQLLENKTRDNRGHINQKGVKNYPELVEKFDSHINEGINKLADDNSVKAKYLKGVLLVSRGTFVKLFLANFKISSPAESIKTYQKADRYGAEGLALIINALKKDKNLCAAKFMLAKAKYELYKLGFINRTIISASNSLTFNILGGNFDINQAWFWIYDTVWCTSPYYYQKEANWDKVFVYKEMLFDAHIAGNLDQNGYSRLINALKKLRNRFPQNERIEKELRLIQIYLDNVINQ